MQPSEGDWIARGLRSAELAAGAADVEAVLAALTQVLRDDPPAGWDRQDTDAGLHRDVHFELFRRAGLAPALADELYRLTSDTQQDVMAEDAPEALRRLAGLCDAVVIVSDIHVDLRPWFRNHDLDRFITHYVLSHEHAVQKPDAEIFRVALAAAAVAPSEALMVGDRANYDGGAVNVGIPTLLLPPLRSASDRRLHLAVTAASGASGASGATTTM
jgi:FMN phosphatase YigB (HAD superfamily)